LKERRKQKANQEMKRKVNQETNQKANQKTKRKIKPIFVLFMLIVGAVGFSSAAFADNEKSDVIVGDLISPLKFKIQYDENRPDEKESVFLTITNTGEVSTEYVCYFEQKNGKKDLESALEISEKQISLLPNETKKIEISILNKQLKNTTSGECQLKVVRNPKTKTPVGYIIPIEITGKAVDDGNETGSGSGSKTGSGNKNQLQIGTGNETKNETNASRIEKGNETGNESVQNETNQTNPIKKSETEKKNKFLPEGPPKIGVVLSLTIVLLTAGWLGMAARKMKKE